MRTVGKYEVSNIRVFLEDEREIVEGVLIHNGEEQFKDGDCILCWYREDEFESAEDIEDALFDGYSESDFRVDDCGTYHIGEYYDPDCEKTIDEHVTEG